MTNIVCMSLWRNDEEKDIYTRMMHLFSKEGVTRWVWVVGDSEDNTEQILRQFAHGKPIQVVRFDTCIEGEAPKVRLQRLSDTANAGLDCVQAGDDYWIIHESDLITPQDIALQFLDTGKDVIAGWPVLGDIFYDTFAYRKDGVMFTNTPPYHACYHPEQLFELDSVGSCWMFPAQALRDGMRCINMGVLDLCAFLKAAGHSIWCDPLIPVIQPANLWVSREHA